MRVFDALENYILHNTFGFIVGVFAIVMFFWTFNKIRDSYKDKDEDE
jgi:hypothetical protein